MDPHALPPPHLLAWCCWLPVLQRSLWCGSLCSAATAGAWWEWSEVRKWWLCVDREKETWRRSAALHEQFCSRWHQTDLMSQSYHMLRGWVSTLLRHFTHNLGFTFLYLDLWKPYRSSQIIEAAFWNAGLHSVLHTGVEHVWVNHHVWRLSTNQHNTWEQQLVQNNQTLVESRWALLQHHATWFCTTQTEHTGVTVLSSLTEPNETPTHWDQQHHTESVSF